MSESWIWLTLCSGAALGIYEVAKKISVRDNPVAPVLYLNAVVCSLIWLPPLVISYWSSDASWLGRFEVESINADQHIALFIKSLIVGASWSLAYFAVKQLPISISGPIRATSPFWTILFATTVLGETPGGMQWLGMAVVLVAFYAFSLVGKREGIHFHRDRWVALMMLATLFAAVSSLYDKYLLQTLAIAPPAVQAWFSIYMLIVLAPLLIYWRFVDKGRKSFTWKHSIAGIAIALLIADFFYFTAVSQPGAMISVISTLRRTSIVVSFLIGIYAMGEKSFVRKAICIALMLFGVALITLSAQRH